jgi:hypothetical protein
VQIEDILDYIQASINAETAAKEPLEAARVAEHQRELDVARQIADQQRQRADAERRAAEEQRQRAEAEARVADEQRRRADAETLRARTLRRTTAVVGAAAVLAVTLGAIDWYQFTVVEQRADETTAALIWSRLDFEKTDDPHSEAPVRALWDLASGNAAVRDAFQQLAKDRYHVATLASGPSAILRAFGLQPEPADVRRLPTPVLDAIRQTTDPFQLRALAPAVQTLRPRLAPE